jgi:cholera toxin transcriptional activator
LPYPSAYYRFGVFELDGRTGELRKNGRNGQRLAGQPLELLLHLLERAGDLVSRDELRQRLWPADTFVDYDHSLNAAVNQLREALGDTADSPRFIQTIPRRGYRFVAPVDTGERAPAITILPGGEIAAAGSAPTVPGESIQATRSGGLLSDAHGLPTIPNRSSRVLFALLQTMYLSFYVLAMADLSGVDEALGRLLAKPVWAFVLVIVTACVGIAVRLYLLAATAFGYRNLTIRFRRMFPVLLLLDELWSLAPFLIVERIGWGLALAATASLAFLPFSQRSVLLMGDAEEFPDTAHR